MNKYAKSKKSKVPKLTEEQYANYVMSLKEEKPIAAYSEFTKKDIETNPKKVQPEK